MTYESPESNESHFVENGAILKIGDFVKVILMQGCTPQLKVIHLGMSSKFSIFKNKLGGGS